MGNVNVLTDTVPVQSPFASSQQMMVIDIQISHRTQAYRW